MSIDTTRTDARPVDEAWYDDWVSEGLAALELYLARHAAFAEYLAAHGIAGDGVLDLDDGDGAASD
jgi:hypothetical protein